MSEARLDGLRRSLDRDARDPGVWAELGRVCTRVDRLPGWLSAPGRLEDLCHAWIASPEEPAMRELMLRLLDWEETDEPVSPWWEHQGRLVRQGERCYDLATGLPLIARRRRDGAVVLLVPEGPFPRGSHSGEPPGASSWPTPPDRWEATPVDPFYLDRDPVTVARFAGFPEARWRPGEAAYGEAHFEAQARHPERPVVAVAWEGARAYAAWVGGVLPTVLEWERAATGDHRRAYPHEAAPGEESFPDDVGQDADLVFDRYYEDPYDYGFDGGGGAQPYWNWSADLEVVGERNRGPFGHRGLAGNAAEWCEDRRGPEAATKGGSWMSPRSHLAIAHTEWRAAHEHRPSVGFRVAHRLFGPQPSLFG